MELPKTMRHEEDRSTYALFGFFFFFFKTKVIPLAAAEKDTETFNGTLLLVVMGLSEPQCRTCKSEVFISPYITPADKPSTR